MLQLRRLARRVLRGRPAELGRRRLHGGGARMFRGGGGAQDGGRHGHEAL